MKFLSDWNKARKEKKIPKIKGLSDHESFHANYVGYMSLAMALCQIPYILVIALLMWVKKDPIWALSALVFVPFIIIMLRFGNTRSKMIADMPQDDRAVVVRERDKQMRILLRIQTVSVAILIILFGVSLL